MKAIYKVLAAALALCALSSCNEKEFLTEEPYSIYSTENALVSESDYQAMVNHLYFQVKRSIVCCADQDVTISLRSCNDYGYYDSDVAWVDHNMTYLKGNNDLDNFLVPTNTSFHKDLFKFLWDVICNANVVISRVGDADFAETSKNVFKGEALFARSWAYMNLAHIFGGMPILEEEVTTPRRDYVRDTREDTYKFALQGFTEAASLLPNIDAAGDGKANKQICQHFMAEVNICLKDYSAAINAADAVINYSGCSLMKSRFGKLADKPGDVYWDLFRDGNYNYSCGNHEGLYVYQVDYGNSASLYDNKGDNDYFVREYNPRYFKMSITYQGKGISPFASYAVVGLCGRAYGYNHPTDHFIDEIWEGMDGDIRNSSYNIMRDVRCNNTNYPQVYGKWFVADGVLEEAVKNGFEPYAQFWWPFITKVANTVYDWPENEIVSPFEADEFYYARASEKNGNGLGRDHSHKDSYMARLAETYLLRAEAHVLNNQPAEAANDINVLRDRANAPKVTGTVDLDYVLDERMRELYAEENRTITLLRMGKYAERTSRYNRFTAWGKVDDHFNLFPIPQAVIEANALATFEQNPGY